MPASSINVRVADPRLRVRNSTSMSSTEAPGVAGTGSDWGAGSDEGGGEEDAEGCEASNASAGSEAGDGCVTGDCELGGEECSSGGGFAVVTASSCDGVGLDATVVEGSGVVAG